MPRTKITTTQEAVVRSRRLPTLHREVTSADAFDEIASLVKRGFVVKECQLERVISEDAE